MYKIYIEELFFDKCFNNDLFLNYKNINSNEKQLFTSKKYIISQKYKPYLLPHIGYC